LLVCSQGQKAGAQAGKVVQLASSDGDIGE